MPTTTYQIKEDQTQSMELEASATVEPLLVIQKFDVFAYPLYIYRTKLPTMLEKDEVADEIES